MSLTRLPEQLCIIVTKTKAIWKLLCGVYYSSYSIIHIISAFKQIIMWIAYTKCKYFHKNHFKFICWTINEWIWRWIEKEELWRTYCWVTIINLYRLICWILVYSKAMSRHHIPTIDSENGLMRNGHIINYNIKSFLVCKWLIKFVNSKATIVRRIIIYSEYAVSYFTAIIADVFWWTCHNGLTSHMLIERN